MAKLNFISILILISFGLFAQGKLYFTPSVRFLVSAYSGVDSVNSRQNFLKTKPFTRKDFLIGGSFMYSNKNYTIKLGLDEGVYSSGHYYDKERQNAAPNQIYSVSKETLSSVDGPYTIYLEYARTFKKMVSLKMPNWLEKITHRPYIFTSKIKPFIGAEFRTMGLSFANDYIWYNSSILTIDYGSIPGSYYLHLHNKKQFAMRTGLDWVFYNNDKPRFILSFMYQFAFKDAGYFRYHFTEPSQGIDFYYQTATRGNGFSIKAGFPIKLWQINRNK